MGFFGPIYSKKPTEWFYSEKAKEFYEKARGTNRRYDLTKFFESFIDSLDNIKRIDKSNKDKYGLFYIKGYMVDILCHVALHKVKDVFGNYVPNKDFNFDVIFNKSNEFVCIYYLKHIKYPCNSKLASYTIGYLFETDQIDGREDWLYDGDIFDNTDEIVESKIQQIVDKNGYTVDIEHRNFYKLF